MCWLFSGLMIFAIATAAVGLAQGFSNSHNATENCSTVNFYNCQQSVGFTALACLILNIVWLVDFRMRREGTISDTCGRCPLTRGQIWSILFILGGSAVIIEGIVVYAVPCCSLRFTTTFLDQVIVDPTPPSWFESAGWLSIPYGILIIGSSVTPLLPGNANCYNKWQDKVDVQQAAEAEYAASIPYVAPAPAPAPRTEVWKTTYTKAYWGWWEERERIA